MSAKQLSMNMPELPVFARSLAGGFVLAEASRVGFYVGEALAPRMAGLAGWAACVALACGIALCVTYLIQRRAHAVSVRMVQSLRFDLLLAVGIGAWINVLVSNRLTSVHDSLAHLPPAWAGVVVSVLALLLLSPLVRHFMPRRKRRPPQLHFLGDEEIADEKDDLLSGDAQATAFAETVLDSGAHPGLVFGVDGPWGVGKTSFINLAQRVWDKATDRVIVCRFEPLRYASEADLADRLIRDVSAAIQRQVFAPEFRPAANRYSRLVKGKADLTFLGFKISLEPGQESLDDLLQDIDDVLRRIGRRVIIVIDDLDRLDAKTTNSVLFATRRTFKLSQATFVLCYDTEILVSSKEEDAKAREFLEKFVTVKLSLFVDSTKLRDFLMREWQRPENQLGSIPSDTMLKLGAVLSELAAVLDSDIAAHYLPLVGDLRKLKRFVNAMLLMQLEKSDLGRTDFNKRDLVNLILLHLNFPGLFRRIYAEETEGRSGTFSARRDFTERTFKNAPDFAKLHKAQPESAGFLLRQLFDVGFLGLATLSDIDEATLASRACFNCDESRNLEAYLKLIVRFATPEPQQTYVLYQRGVDQVREGKANISAILESDDFRLERSEDAHDQFWRVLVNQSSSFNQAVAQDAIKTLVAYLPRYSTVDPQARGLRQISIYSLVRLLDRAGWGRTATGRRANSPENVREVAQRIFGEGTFEGDGLLTQLVSQERGVLGWYDLMLFRLQCSADRQGQLYNLQSALLVHEDPKATTTGLTSALALEGMRTLSQRVFALFKRDFILAGRNFYTEVDSTPDAAFLGEVAERHPDLALSRIGRFASLNQAVSAARAGVKSFVMYQLANALPPTGSGVGCGYYDEAGSEDGHGIAAVMNAYAFDLCFDPLVNEDNALHFLDHCLGHLSNAFFASDDERGYIASKQDLVGGFDPLTMGGYWRQHRELLMRKAQEVPDREVVTSNYVTSYRELAGVYAVLDEFANLAAGVVAR